MIDFLALFSIPAFIVAVIALIRPLKRIGLGQKWRSVALLLVSLAVFIWTAATAIERHAVASVRAAMRDPASAKFRNVRSVPGATAVAICGEVNGKNGFGAYAGFKRFYVRDKSISVEPQSGDEIEAEYFDSMYDLYCSPRAS